MKINIQTLKSQKHPLEVAETDTVRGRRRQMRDAALSTTIAVMLISFFLLPSLLLCVSQILSVKQRVSSELQLGDVADQKLIYLGKILANEQTIGEVKIKPNDILVVMVSKVKKAAPAPTPAPAAAVPATPAPVLATPAPAAPAATPAAPLPAAAPATNAVPPTPIASIAASLADAAPTAAAPATLTASAADSVQMGSAYEESMLGLMALGFERAQAADAMRAAYNNADRAAEYLFGPESVLRAALAQAGAGPAANTQTRAAQQAPPATTTPAVPVSGNAATGGPSTSDLLDLASGAGIDQAQIAQLRELLQSNPSLGPLLLQQVAQSSPEVMAQLGNDPAALEQLLGGLAAGGAGGRSRQPRGQTIQITQEEKSQLDNLESLGFSRDVALEAWLICDRNEEVAANYLFEHGGEIAMEDAEGMHPGDEYDDDHDMQQGMEDDDEDGDIDGPFYE